MVSHVARSAAVRNNINHLRDTPTKCKKCNGVIYLQTFRCGRCLCSAQKLNGSRRGDSFERAVHAVDAVGYDVWPVAVAV